MALWRKKSNDLTITTDCELSGDWEKVVEKSEEPKNEEKKQPKTKKKASSKK